MTIQQLVLANTNAGPNNDPLGWTLVNPPAPGTQIAPGSYLDVTVKFVAASIPTGQTENQTVGALDGTTRNTDGGAWSGTLTIHTDDADEPTTVVKLAGWWQRKSELNQEPSLPVIVNRDCGMLEQVEDGRTGFIVDLPNRVTVETHLRTLRASPEARAALGATAREHVATTYSLPAIGRGLLHALRRVS